MCPSQRCTTPSSSARPSRTISSSSWTYRRHRAPIVTLSSDEVKKDDSFAKISPRRVAPLLVLPSGEQIVSGAISLYILERFDAAGKLHPLPGSPNRARFLQATFYTAAEMFPTAGVLFRYCMANPKEKRDPKVVAALIEKFEKVVIAHLERDLDGGKRKYYLGEEFSAADVCCSYITMTATFVQGEDLLAKSSVVTEYANRMAERKSYKALFTMPSMKECFRYWQTMADVSRER